MAKTFRHIGLIGKFGDPGVADTLTRLAEYLGNRKLAVTIDAQTAEMLPSLPYHSASREEMGEQCDLAIVVGGDGTLLNAARSLAAHGVPILGVNLGRLGFMVDVSADEMEQRLDEILDGEYTSEDRVLLHAKIKKGETVIHEGNALNDVVVHKLDVARMIELETSINGKLLNRQRSDGLIVATPTGSTAYALSGGGPIMDPSLDAVVLVPICPHTLSNRPIAIGDRCNIEITVLDNGSPEAQVTWDGQVNFTVKPGHRIQICRTDQPLRLIHPKGYDYFHILREKLHWGGHH